MPKISSAPCSSCDSRIKWMAVLQQREDEAELRKSRSSSRTADARKQSSLTPSIASCVVHQSRAQELVSLTVPIFLPTDIVGFVNFEAVCAVMLYNMSLAQAANGDAYKAFKLLQLSIKSQPTVDSRDSMSSIVSLLAVSSQYNMGMLYQSQGDESGALMFIYRALMLGREHFGNNVLVAPVLHKLGHILWRRGRLHEADAAFKETLRLFSQLSTDLCNSELEKQDQVDGAAPAA